jgi:hypothetical protein
LRLAVRVFCINYRRANAGPTKEVDVPVISSPAPAGQEYAFHPLANTFPLLEGGEFAALVEDVRVYGLIEPITRYESMILDGRNRYRACIAAGVEPRFREARGLGSHAEAVAFVISANVHRRHLSMEQRRDLIAKLLKAKPEQSDRRIAGIVHVSPTMVGGVRKRLEETGDVSNLDTRIDSKGRAQPAKKPPKAKSPAAQAYAAKRKERAKAERDERKAHRRLERTVFQIRETCSHLDKDAFELPHEIDAADIDKAVTTLKCSVTELEAFIARLGPARAVTETPRDIGPYSPGENDRLRFRVEALNNEKRALEIKIGALESEVEQLKQLDHGAGSSDADLDVQTFNGGILLRCQS